MKKLVAVFLCFLLVLLSCNWKSVVKAEKKEEMLLSLHAKGAVLLDGSSGRVLYGNKGSTERLPMASTTKIMTCIITLEQGNTEEFAKVSKRAQAMPKVHLTVQEGEYYKVSDLLYSLMLESHNDSAVVLAEHIGGTVEGFAEKMNQLAKEIGCENTNFVTPNGLDDENHYTTAEELAKIMRYCIYLSEKREEFLKITRTSTHNFTNYKENGEKGQRSFTVNNKNAFLYMMDGALSGKTGFTSKAGYCYVGALEKDGKCLIVALLACGWPGHKTWKWEDTRKLMEYGLSSFEYKIWYEPPKLPLLTVLEGKTIEAKQKTIDMQIRELISPKKRVSLSIEAPESTEGMLLRSTDEITMKMTLVESLEAPVAKGVEAGCVSYYLNEELLKSFPVTVNDNVEKIDFRWIVRRLVKLYFL